MQSQFHKRCRGIIGGCLPGGLLLAGSTSAEWQFHYPFDPDDSTVHASTLVTPN